MLLHLIPALGGRRLNGGVLADQAVYKRTTTCVSPVLQNADCVIPCTGTWFRLVSKILQESRGLILMKNDHQSIPLSATTLLRSCVLITPKLICALKLSYFI